MSAEDEKHMEMFIGCQSLVLSPRDAHVFVVVSSNAKNAKTFHELIRTETVCQGPNPKFCTSFIVPYNLSKPPQRSAIFEVYIRKSVTSERLSDQEKLAHVAVPLQSILSAPGNHLNAKLAAPTGGTNGLLTISAEPVDMTDKEAHCTLELDVRAVALRKKDWSRTFIPQRYELLRAHAHPDAQGMTVWLPVHQSDRVSKLQNASQFIDFTTASLSYRHLWNGDKSRRLRIVLSSGSAKSGSCEADIGYVDLTWRELCEMDLSEDVFKIQCDGMPQDVGHVRIVEAEPTDYGGYFSLLMNYRASEMFSVANETLIQKAMSGVLKTPRKPTLRTPRSIKGGRKATIARHVTPADLFATNYSD